MFAEDIGGKWPDGMAALTPNMDQRNSPSDKRNKRLAGSIDRPWSLSITRCLDSNRTHNCTLLYAELENTGLGAAAGVCNEYTL